MGIYKPDFLEKFSQKFFTNISFMGLSPPFDLTKCHIWGDTGGGTPHLRGREVSHTPQEIHTGLRYNCVTSNREVFSFKDFVPGKLPVIIKGHLIQ